MRNLKNISRPSPALIVALLAFAVAAGGPAAAADFGKRIVHVITGKQVKDNSLTGKDVKDGSLLAKDFKAGQLPVGSAGSGTPGARGPQGETGARGPQGERGLPGAPGANGDQGPQGESGAKGEPGAPGSQGERGPQGEQGDKGDQGIQGPKGDQGPQGPGPAPAEAWHLIGFSGQPVFAKDVGFPGYEWSNSWDWPQSQAGFYKDPYGVVHLKGKVRCVGNTCGSASLIFQLPAGYRPAERSVFATLSDDANSPGQLARVNVEPEGWVDRAPGPRYGWLVLDGITFRAAQ